MNTHLRHLGKYELRERLGYGGMAEVWKAMDTQLHRYVAIKLLHTNLQDDPTFVTRFLREARMMASLRHANIVQVHDFQVSEPPESENPIAYMVMDYIEGTTLADYIQRTSGVKQFPTASEIVNLFTSISSAVDYAHQHAMIHRDIKPANILLDQHYTAQNPMGEPMLTDFGIAKLLGPSTSAMSGSWLGTLSYIAPEQVQGYPGNERSDLYSLGVILYEICTGTLPFQGATSTQLVSQRLNKAPRHPRSINPDISPSLSSVILRSLAKSAQDRFPSASSMTAALAEALNIHVPENLNVSPHPAEVDMRPTVDRPPSPGMSSPQSPSLTPPSLLASGAPSLPLVPSSSGSPQGVSLHLPRGATPLPPPAQGIPGVSSPLHPPSSVRISSPGATPINGHGVRTPVIPATAPLPLSIPVTPPPPKRRRGLLFAALIAMLTVVLLAAGLGGLLLLTHQPPAGMSAQAATNVAFFVSTGQIAEGNNQGVEDQLQITLHHISPPASGKSYYAWLLNDKVDTTQACKPHPNALEASLLGKLQVSSAGDVSYLYPGNQQHSNLIVSTSRFLVTEQDTQATPPPPTVQDTRTWRYYAELPQQPARVSPCLRTIDFMRRFLADGAQLLRMGIRGGINLRIFKNAQKILEWTGSARDAWGKDPAFINRQVVRVLLLLDSVAYVQNDVPPGTSLQLNEDARLAMIQVVDHQTGDATSYIKRIHDQLNQMLRTPGITTEIRKIATQDLQAVPTLQDRFGQVRADARLLVVMNEAQLAQPAALQLLNDMQMQANSAFTGEVDATTGNVQPGVMQVYYSLQQLATFHVQPYETSHQ